MASDYTLLKNDKAELNLDIAVLLAEASEAAYSQSDADNWVARCKFGTATHFNVGNIQGFWCVTDSVALLVFRGTSNPGQWIRDARILPADHGWGLVHRGFGKGVEAVDKELREFAAKAKDCTIWISGHSLGGALAVITAATLKILGFTAMVYTYGQPRAGFGEFAERFNLELPGRLYRFINKTDIVARVPPDPFYRHTGTPKRIVQVGDSTPRVKLAAVTSANNAIQNVMDAAERDLTTIADNTAVSTDEFFLADMESESLSALEFSQLQNVLGADSEALGNFPEDLLAPEAYETQLTGAAPIFADHAISEYVRLLAEINSHRP